MAKKPDTKEKTAEVQAPYVSKYTINELADAAKTAFHTEKAIVMAALKAENKEEFSMEEATALVNKFKNKEVTK